MLPALALSAVVRAQFGVKQGVRTHLVDVGGDRAIVVAHGNPSTSIDWARSLHVPRHIQLPRRGNTHLVGEIEMWMRWIRDNYDNLPDYTIFSDDRGPHAWHSKATWRTDLLHRKPCDTHMLGKQLYDRNLKGCFLRSWELGGCASQTWQCATTLLAWFERAYDRSLHSPVCCSVMIVSRNAIRQHLWVTYDFVVKMLQTHMTGHPDLCASGYWGYALERIGHIIFSLPGCG